MAIRAAERDAQPALLELVCHCLRILDRLCLQFFELSCLRQFERQCQPGKHVDVRSALFAGEDRFIDLLCNRRVGCL